LALKALSGMFTSVMLSGILYAFTASSNASFDFFPYDSFIGIAVDTTKKDTTRKDSSLKDSTRLKYPIRDNPLYGEKQKNNLDFPDPENIRKEVYYDTADGTYKERQLVGDEDYRPLETKTFEEYLAGTEKEETREYFKQRSQAQSFVRGGGLIPPLKVGPKIFDKIFGGGVIDIRPQGSAELIFGWNYNVVRNPSFTARQQKNGQFDFKQKIQINLTGSIGDRLKLSTNYDTEATFEFENQMKLNWAGKEDDIIKAVELGNVSLPLNSSLINGGQSLFGVKTQLQFGRVTVTSIFTQQRGQTTETQVTGGAQITKFDIQADNYDVNRHFFLSHYFADNYDRWLSNLPAVQSPVNINRVEVWVTNRTNDFTTTRDVVGYMDLGEGAPYNGRWGSNPMAFPDNAANTLYGTVSSDPAVRSSFTSVQTLEAGTYSLDKIQDFQYLANARQLNANEFTFHRQLGYLSLNTSLNNDDILLVAYEYTVNGAAYQVGEFSIDVSDDQANPKILNLKMLKGATITSNLPVWDLMMKNVYSLGAFNIQEEKFNLNVIYADDYTGADYSYLPVQGEPLVGNEVLINVLNLDRVNIQREPTPDGTFDFIPGLTILPNNGRIIFPVREPFGSYLRSKLSRQENIDKYVFQELYDSTKWLAQTVVQKNKFFLRGSFQSSSNNEISLNAFNIPKGSVKVTANGTLLNEGSDYIVDYTLGKVTIINTGLLESGAVINVSSENNSFFNIQQKTLVGTRVDFKVNRDLILGGTLLHLWERPLTPKVNIGEEPLLNTMVGFDGSYKRDSRWLTKMVDRLPFIETKEISSITVAGEYAQLFPHQPKTIGERGTSFIDDFEGSETPFDLRSPAYWFLASTPEGQPDLLPEGNSLGNEAGYYRAKLAWYNIDPIFQRDQLRTDPRTPPHLVGNVQSSSNHYTRLVNVPEVFPNKQLQNMQPQNITTLDLAYYPSVRGPYNYNPFNLNPDGTLQNPQRNWAGIQRKIETNDFEAANIDYMEIWVMSPFMNDPAIKGTLYINLGQISEDVLKDRAKSFENGLPTDPAITTQSRSTGIAIVPTGRTLNNAFVNDGDARNLQDVGLDGMNDEAERVFYKGFLDSIASIYGTGSQVYQQLLEDPSGDNYRFHSSSQFDNAQTPVLERYRNINNQQGNSPLATFQPDGYPVGRTNVPDDEDINGDFSLNTIEEYFQYKIEIDKNLMVEGQNFVADIQEEPVKLDDGNIVPVTWYLLRIPVNAYDKKIGNIDNFKSIRFMRMFMTGFDKPVVLRFAQFQLVRAEWRRYLKSLADPVDQVPTTPGDNTSFSTGTVNIEENGFRNPVRYVLPPGFFRTVNVATPGNVQQNEQSLSVRVCDLEDGDARGVFRTNNLDIRNYKKLQMFVHAEEAGPTLNDGDIHAFIRVGTDLESNYYEYSVPLKITRPGATTAEEIWPAENELNILLEEFYLTKQLRSNARVPLTEEYIRLVSDGKMIRVKGLPDLSNVRVIMLGVRNPLQRNDPANDDGQKKCAEVWFNELRVSEFINQGGWAANARLTAKLADLGTVAASVNYQSIGFGGIDKKLNDRNLNETFMYDLNGSFEMGKFFPVKSGISVPLFIGHSEQIIRPKYNPLNPDILLETAIRAAPTQEEKDIIRRNAEDLTVRRSFNLTNVRKNRMGSEKPHFYDIENFNVSYSYTYITQRNQTIAENMQKTYRGSLGYNFSSGARPIQPFKKVGGSPWLALVREFTFTPLPASVGFRGDIDRYYSRLINRNNDDPNTIVPVLYNKNFTITRFYDFRWDITGNLKVDYQANAKARVDEPVGRISREENPDSVQVIIDNLKNLGRMTNYNQKATANYNVPINKIPLFKWVNLTAIYAAGYEWRTAAPATPELGNDIQNSQSASLVGQFNMISLYDKIPYFRKVNSGVKKTPPRNTNKEEGKEPGKEEKTREKNYSSGLGPGLARFVMMLKNASFNYTVTRGILLPGYAGVPKYFGNDFSLNSPGLPFIFGSQDSSIRYRLAGEGQMTTDTNIFQQYTQLSTVNFSPKATFEPFRGLRIDMNWQKTEVANTQALFKYDPVSGQFQSFGLQNSGNYNVTFNSLRTSFSKLDNLNRSAVFSSFENNRYTVASRMATEDPRVTGRDTSGYPKGYGRKSQDVLIYSFIAAYSGKNASNSALSAFPKIPFPAWNVTYNGLTRLKSVARYFSNVTLRHGYNSMYTVAGYTTSVNRADTNTDGNFQPNILIRTVTITEQLNPLISLDVGLKNDITARIEYKSSRNIQLDLNSYKIIENNTTEFIIGMGYKTRGIRLPIRINRKKVFLENDLNIRFDLSIRDAKTIVMEIDNISATPAQGNKIISIKPTIDYSINDKLNLRIFYDRRATHPVVATSYPTAITQGGISLRYTIQ
jgi:cell surface protein SprA